MGDPHYISFDSTVFDNMGFCQYILSTNGGCGETWPLLTENFDFKADDDSQDFYMIIVDQDHLDFDPGYTLEIAKLNGISIYWRPKTSGTLYRISQHKDFSGWKWEMETGNQTFTSLNENNFFQNSVNLEAANLAIRTSGGKTDLYIGTGTQSNDQGWLISNSASVTDFLVKVTFYFETFPPPHNSLYGFIGVQANCVLQSKVCGMCGDYDGYADHDSLNFGGFSNVYDWFRHLQRKHFYDGPPSKCGLVNPAGTHVPTNDLAVVDPTGTTSGCDDDTIARQNCEILLSESVFSSCSIDKTKCSRSHRLLFDYIDLIVTRRRWL